MEAQHILALSASNVQRLTAVEIRPDPTGIVILSGKNKAGKSSVLDAILMALGGGKEIPKKPIRDGADEGDIIVTTEKLIVHRKITAAGAYLDIRTNDAEKLKYPGKLQNILDTLVKQSGGFDPMAFARMKAQDQTAQLLRVCPVAINLTETAQAISMNYAARTEANREVKRIEALLASQAKPAKETPTQEVSVTALADEHQRLRQLAETEAEKDETARQAEIAVGECTRQLLEANATIEKLAKELELARGVVKQRKSQQDAARELFQSAASISKAKKDYTAEIATARASMVNAETTNRTIRAAAQYRQTQAQLKTAEDCAKKWDDKLTALETGRAQALAAAKFPVPGMSIDAEGVITLNKIPIERASTMEQIFIGIDLFVAADPTLKVAFIRDGSLLDSDSMKAIAEKAKAKGLQVWIERVEDNSPAAIQIIDGSNLPVAQVEAKAKKAKKKGEEAGLLG